MKSVSIDKDIAAVTYPYRIVIFHKILGDASCNRWSKIRAKNKCITFIVEHLIKISGTSLTYLLGKNIIEFKCRSQDILISVAVHDLLDLMLNSTALIRFSAINVSDAFRCMDKFFAHKFLRCFIMVTCYLANQLLRKSIQDNPAYVKDYLRKIMKKQYPVHSRFIGQVIWTLINKTIHYSLVSRSFCKASRYGTNPSALCFIK